MKPLPGSQMEITVVLSPEEVNSYFDKAYQRLSDSGKIRGFRPGKAPKNIVRLHFGEEQVKASVYVELVEDVLPGSLEQLGDRQVLGEPALPAFEEITLDEDAGFTLPITVAVYPEATVGDLGEVKLLRPPAEVTDADVDRVIEELRDQKATWTEATEAVKPGDRVTADVVISVDGKEVSQEEGFQLVAAEPVEGEDPSVATKVIGHLAGQTVTLEEPERELEQEIEEKEGRKHAPGVTRYEAKITKIEEKHLPELDDSFAAGLGEYSTVDELKAEVRQQLNQERGQRSEDQMQSQAVAYLLAATDVELPDVLVAQATAARIDNLQEEIEGIGSTLEELVDAGHLDMGRVEATERQRAELGLETKLALDALIAKEKLEPAEEDVEAEVVKLARSTHSEDSFVRQAYELQDEVREQIDSRARVRRAVRWIIDQAQVEEVPAEEFGESHRKLIQELEDKRNRRREATKEAAQKAAEGAEGEEEAGEAQPEGEAPKAAEAAAEAPAVEEAARAPAEAAEPAKPAEPAEAAEPAQAADETPADEPEAGAEPQAEEVTE